MVTAAVGDTIVIHFKNNAQFPASLHPHGVFYDKANEGAPYDDGTSGNAKGDDAVPPGGGTRVYTWAVPERAGPGPNDGSSVFWMYHSHTDEVMDTYTGLMGPLVITAAGKARSDGSPADIDVSLYTMFLVSDENQSHYLDQNIQLAGDPGSIDPEDEGFIESNLMHSINGYVYGNLPGLTMSRGDRVRWNVMGMGTEVDLHTPHWHGNTVLFHGLRQDVVELLPATTLVADMKPDDPGTWLYHCHVNDHIIAGHDGPLQGQPIARRRVRSKLPLLAAALVAAASCGDQAATADALGTDGCGARQLVLVNCSGCHDGVSETTGFLDLTSPDSIASLVGKPAAGPKCVAGAAVLINTDGSGLFLDKLAGAAAVWRPDAAGNLPAVVGGDRHA